MAGRRAEVRNGLKVATPLVAGSQFWSQEGKNIPGTNNPWMATMPRHRAGSSGAEETQKSRVSKYRKRLPSMFSKAEKFAIDTDVQMMVLCTVSKDGKCMSIAAGEKGSLNPITGYIREKYPTGKHRFIEKKRVSRFWRVVEDGPMHASQGREESEVIKIANKRTRATAQISTISRVETLGNVQSSEPNNNDRTSNALGETNSDSIEVPGKTREQPFESPRHTPDVGLAQEVADLHGEPDETILENLLESSHTPGNLDEISGMSGGVMRNTDECNVIELDTPAQNDLPADSILAETSNTSFQDQSSQSFEGVGTFEEVSRGRLRMDLRQLILDWGWVFRPHVNPLEQRPAIASGTS